MLRYGVLGDSVNVAARLKSLNTHFGTSCLVSDESLEEAGLSRLLSITCRHWAEDFVGYFSYKTITVAPFFFAPEIWGVENEGKFLFQSWGLFKMEHPAAWGGRWSPQELCGETCGQFGAERSQVANQGGLKKEVGRNMENNSSNQKDIYMKI